jgi:hypothetical protein
LAAGTVTSSQVNLTWAASTDDISGVAFYRIYRNGSPLNTSVSPAYSDMTVAASTTYTYHVSAVDNAQNESQLSDPLQVSVPSGAGWLAFQPPRAQQGTPSSFDVTPFAPAGAAAIVFHPTSAAQPPGWTAPGTMSLQYDGAGAASADIPNQLLEDLTPQERDWRLRSGQLPGFPQPGVMWLHDFRSNAEVDQFRWCDGYGGGQCPVLTGGAQGNIPFPGNTRRITSDGIAGAGSGVLEIVAHSGAISNPNQDTAEWWRPFSALNAPGNGRTAPDPGGSGAFAVTRRTWSVSNQSSTLAGWGQGWYGHPSYHGTNQFDGSEWWLQCRLKIDPNRFAAGNDVGGKLFYFTRNDRSQTTQEIVTESRELDTGLPFFSLYHDTSHPLESYAPGVSVHGNQPGIEGGLVGNGVCRFDNNGGRRANCWQYPLNSWFTLMFHFIPGRQGVNENVMEAHIQEVPGIAPRRVWLQTYPMTWDVVNGHNTVIFSCYQNRFGGNEINVSFWQRITQIIFSKQPIPFPAV